MRYSRNWPGDTAGHVSGASGCRVERRGLGGIGSLFRTTAAIKRDIDMVRRLTSQPFAIDHIPQNTSQPVNPTRRLQ